MKILALVWRALRFCFAFFRFIFLTMTGELLLKSKLFPDIDTLYRKRAQRDDIIRNEGIMTGVY